MSQTLTEPSQEKLFLEAINTRMAEYSEPIIKEQVAKFERDLREKLGGMLIGLIQSNVDFMRDGRDLHIILRQAITK